MPDKKILYIDTPFLKEKGGDKNRSRNLYSSLKSSFDVKIVTVVDDSEKRTFEHSIRKKKPSFFSPHSIFCYSKSELQKIERLIEKYNINIVFLRFLSHFKIAQYIHRRKPSVSIIVDVDMIQSKIAYYSWILNKSYSNRFYLFEYIKLFFFERYAFKQNFHFLFANKKEAKDVEKNILYNKKYIIPNFIYPVDIENSSLIEKDYILFYGSLSSSSNKNALEYLINDIAPKIQNDLLDKKIDIYIVGKGNITEYKHKCKSYSFIKIVGEVQDISAYIRHALFAILPIRILSGTCSRLCELSLFKKCVVASPIVLEGLDFTEDDLMIAHNEEDYHDCIKKLLSNPDLMDRYGKALHQSGLTHYSYDVVKNKVVQIVEGI
jgi:glycosyltransferase involved in cell wall biosynthesis